MNESDLANATRIRLSKEEFFALPDYGFALPPQVPGKMWRRLHGADDKEFLARGGKPKWFILRYGDLIEDGAKIQVLFFKPIISVRAEATEQLFMLAPPSMANRSVH